MPPSPEVASIEQGTGSLSFRTARHADLPALLAMLADDFLGKQREFDLDDPAYAQAFAAIEADSNQRLLLAVLGERIVGMAQLSWIPGLSRGGAWRCQIEAVRIAADLRGQGLGARLIEACEAAARERGCRYLQLTSDRRRDDAHRFYRRLGYIDSHLGFKKTLDH